MARKYRTRDVFFEVDDRDSSISYNGAWTPSPDDLGFEGTVTGTTEVGASAMYTFNGSAIQVFGERAPTPLINASIVLDGLQTMYIKHGAVGLQQHQVLFYNRTDLAPGEHTLVITNFGESLILDYFQIALDGSVSSSTTSAPPTAPAVTSVRPSSSTLSSPAQSGNPSSSPPIGHEKSLGTGAIAGIAAGAVALLTLALVGLLCWRRRRRMAAITPYHEDRDTGRAEKSPGRLPPRPQAALAPEDADDMTPRPSNTLFPSNFPPASGSRAAFSSPRTQGRVRLSGTTAGPPPAGSEMSEYSPAQADVDSSSLSTPFVAAFAPIVPAPTLERVRGTADPGKRAVRARQAGASATRNEAGRAVDRHSVDGGVRLAGGPADELNEWRSRPPPYHRY